MGLTAWLKGLLGNKSPDLTAYSDAAEERSWRILEGVDRKSAFRLFPDYDAAYIRACGTHESGGIPGGWDSSLLELGLKNCKRKSELLFSLAANCIFEGQKVEAFARSVQALHAYKGMPFGAGPYVYSCVFLYYTFEALPEVDVGRDGGMKVSQLLALNNPGIEIESSQHSRILDCARAADQIGQDLVLSGANVLRTSLKLKQPRSSGVFPRDYVYRG